MKKKNDMSTWPIGGMVLVGTGVGFIFIETSPILFVASVLVGLGLGLVITSILTKSKD